MFQFDSPAPSLQSPALTLATFVANGGQVEVSCRLLFQASWSASRSENDPLSPKPYRNTLDAASNQDPTTPSNVCVSNCV